MTRRYYETHGKTNSSEARATKTWLSRMLRDPGSAFPLLAGTLGLLFLLADLMPFIELPSGYADEVVLAGASTALIAYWVSSERSRVREERHAELLERVEHIIEDSEVRLIPSRDIGSMLMRELDSSAIWRFKGGSARWFKHVALPRLSKVTSEDVQVQIQVVDPRNEYLCEKFAIFRDRQRDLIDRRPREGDPRTIQTDILSCICAMFWYASRSRISPCITLIHSYSPLRIDVGADALFVTVASRQMPGLFARKGTFFYQGVIDEFEAARNGHSDVTISQPALLRLREEQTFDEYIAELVLSNCIVRAPDPDGTMTPLLADFSGTGIEFKEIAAHVLPPGS